MKMIDNLYKKNEISFAIVMIILYVVLFSVGDNLSGSVGIEKVITLPICLIFTAYILFWLKKNDLFEQYGICGFKGDYKKFLFFIPLVFVATVNFWGGVTVNLSPLETVLHILSMICVGFLEEVIFRGFLFKAMCKDNLKQAVVVSSITFGIGHIVNLLNGAELFSTLLQIAYAVAVGFLFTLIYYYGKTLLPCIIVHAFVNSSSAFAMERSDKFNVICSAILIIISLAYAVFLIQKNKGLSLKTEE